MLDRFWNIKKVLRGYRYHISDAFWIAFVEIVVKLLGFALVIVLTRSLSRDLFGQYNFVFSVIGILSIFNLAGMSNAIVQSVARGFDGTYRKGNLLSLMYSMIGSVFLMGLGFIQYAWDRKEMGITIVLLSILFPFAYGLNNWIQYYGGKGEFRKISLLRSCREMMAHAGIITVVLLKNDTIMYGILSIVLIRSLFNLKYTHDILNGIGKEEDAEANSIEFGLYSSIFGIANTVANHIDKIFLFYFVSAEGLAIYAAADKIPELIKSGIQSYTMLLIPKLSRASSFTKVMESRMNQLSVFFILVILFTTLFVIPWLIPLVYSGEYSESVIYCQVLLGSLCIGMYSTIRYSYIRSKLDIRSFRNINVIPNSVRIIVVIVLVPLFGIAGAIIATILYRIVMLFVINRSLKKYREL